tara:strand:- start:2126 stop:2692 length:567 start_codon:yes stop_codon:yes gene_type:complete
MKKIIHKIQLENNEIELNLMTFKKSDRKVFKKTFNLWQKLNNKITKKLKGTRKLNLPDALSESLVCQELGFGKLLSVKSRIKYSSSYDVYDLKNNKRIQVKCSTSTGPSSFGPKSEWDEIYFLDMWNDGNINGSYKIYKIENDEIYNTKVNKNQKLKDQQNQSRRPRFDLRSSIIIPKKYKPVAKGKL